MQSFLTQPGWRRLLSGVLLLCLAQHAARADVVDLALPGGVTGTAWYQAGNQGPALLLLHGFLQTRDYLTVRALAASLSEQGYTVLLPTLSLGIDRRRNSMSCEAVHTHTLDGDMAEVRAWVGWLKAHGHKDVRLIGHSHGSVLLLAYAGSADAGVQQLIATSLIGVEQLRNRPVFLAQRELARRQVAAGDTQLQPYKFSYCQRYMTSPQGFLSYADWDSERVLETLADLSIPARVILGSTDTRMEAQWPQHLRDRKIAVTMIEGAGHFFDSQYEFDLLDAVTDAIALVPGPVNE